MTDRMTWRYQENSWGEPAIDVTITEAGVLIEVTDEQAVDSYNDTFTCSISLPPEQVAELAGVLLEALEAHSQTTK